MIDMKRLFDIVISLLILPAGILLCLLFGLLFLIINGENPLFIQRRVGRSGHYFYLIKLRTMPTCTKDVPTHQIDSSNISALGRLMRGIKVDEIPQLYNVIKGDMSLVGPRPCLPSQRRLIIERFKLGVYDLKPGITGYAQIKGIDMSSPIELAIEDHAYSLDYSLWVDLKILLMTVAGQGRGDKTIARVSSSN